MSDSDEYPEYLCDLCGLPEEDGCDCETCRQCGDIVEEVNEVGSCDDCFSYEERLAQQRQDYQAIIL